MSGLSNFESRSGKLTCNAEELFAFVTDIRNFEQFLPEATVNNWSAEKEQCRFDVAMIGTVTVRLSEKTKFTRVIYTGDALKKNDFYLALLITDNMKDPAKVKVTLSADLNPMMKMVASKPISQFLELLISKMEAFNGWNNTKE
jgi:ribosome-associated toxin RatA of RatAB toxin-antitoxin module